MKKLDVIVDLQFGSTGKGAIAGYLSEHNEYDAVISINAPNAGHTAYHPETGEKFVHKILPSGIFSPKLRTIGIGPGAIFDIDRLVYEINGLELAGIFADIVIHEAAGVLKQEHRDLERDTLSGISSTMQGSAAALVDKIMRKSNALVKTSNVLIACAEPGILSNVRVVNQSNWIKIFSDCNNILLEGSQGYSLGISSGFYPYCTSRDCTPARIISDASLPITWLRDVYGSARTYPIRVGNTPDGYSGDWYPDQHEISFDSLSVDPETTTVTGRVRRIATFSEMQMREAMAIAMPTYVFLNFCNYFFNEEDVEKMVEKIGHIAHDLGCGGVGFTGWGPKPKEITDIRFARRDTVNKHDIREMRKEVVDWADGKLPDRDPINTGIKLGEEVSELMHAMYTNDGNVGEECADVLALLLDIAHLNKVDIVTEYYTKMRTNKIRNWRVVNGSLKHVEDGK